ncbi:MAG: diaminopimelate dehydrogenase [Clostridiales bacterium]|nr:diaminopimelate dehydrogenase [Clostridiales bacterium]
MTDKIRIGIAGYGNLGKGVEIAIQENADMELTAIFSKRYDLTKLNHPCKDKIFDAADAHKFKDIIDIMILCGGSSKDLPGQGPLYASMFNTVDGYDNHGNIPNYYNAMNKAATDNGNISVVCAGWDPGLFSINRVLFESIMPQGKSYTFWGPGVSQGHSDALRKIPGVKKAIQYTIPVEDNLGKIKKGGTPVLSIREKHKRECYVVIEEHADKEGIRKSIITMPNYFADYDTNVNFISEEEFVKNHSKMFHGGTVIRNGKTGTDPSNDQALSFSLNLGSNSEFTASVLTAYARAAYRLKKKGCSGAKTVFDIPLKYLSNKTLDELCKELL